MSLFIWLGFQVWDGLIEVFTAETGRVSDVRGFLSLRSVETVSLKTPKGGVLGVLRGTRMKKGGKRGADLRSELGVKPWLTPEPELWGRDKPA